MNGPGKRPRSGDLQRDQLMLRKLDCASLSPAEAQQLFNVELGDETSDSASDEYLSTYLRHLQLASPPPFPHAKSTPPSCGSWTERCRLRSSAGWREGWAPSMLSWTAARR